MSHPQINLLRPVWRRALADTNGDPPRIAADLLHCKLCVQTSHSRSALLRLAMRCRGRQDWFWEYLYIQQSGANPQEHEYWNMLLMWIKYWLPRHETFCVNARKVALKHPKLPKQLSFVAFFPLPALIGPQKLFLQVLQDISGDWGLLAEISLLQQSPEAVTHVLRYLHPDYEKRDEYERQFPNPF